MNFAFRQFDIHFSQHLYIAFPSIENPNETLKHFNAMQQTAKTFQRHNQLTKYDDAPMQTNQISHN